MRCVGVGEAAAAAARACRAGHHHKFGFVVLVAALEDQEAPVACCWPLLACLLYLGDWLRPEKVEDGTVEKRLLLLLLLPLLLLVVLVLVTVSCSCRVCCGCVSRLLS